MNLYEVRFVDNSTNNVVYLSQYGNSEKELEDFWKECLKPNRQSKYTFVDAFLWKRNVDSDDFSEEITQAVENFRKMQGIQ